MELVVRKAKKADLDAALEYFDQIVDDMEHAEYTSKWVRGVYPSRAMVEGHIKEGGLYLAFFAEDPGKIVGTFVLNHRHAIGYEQAPWQVEAADEEALVMHLVSVSYRVHKQGVGTKLMHLAMEEARRLQARAIRLEVVDGNVPACRLYERAGFVHIATADLVYPGYESYGPSRSELYELPLEG